MYIFFEIDNRQDAILHGLNTFPHHVLAWHAPYGRAVRCRGNGLGRPRGLVYTWYDVALLCIVWSVLVWYGTA